MNELDLYNQINLAQDIIYQTSDFRFKKQWEEHRLQLEKKGYIISKCFQTSCDAGELPCSTHSYLILSDKSVASIQFSEKGKILTFEIIDETDDFDDQFCISLLEDPERLEAFNKSCEAHYELFWKKEEEA